MIKVPETMSFEFEFTSPMEMDLEESSVGVAIVHGTLLAEGMSRNGNLYTLDEMDHIAKTAEGQSIYYGTTRKYLNGVPVKNAHDNTEPNLVGRIMQTWVDKVARKIKFIAHLVSSEMFPHLIEEVKQGWGVSIGGKGTARFVLDAMGRVLTKIFNLTVNHVQLLPPDTPRGQDAAQIEGIQKEIQESMIFYEMPEPNFKVKEVRLRDGDSVTFTI